MAQLDLFTKQEALKVPPVDVADAVQSLAAQMSKRLRFGTSSWSFPGWQGIVYAKQESQTKLARHGLASYARHPLLRAVGVDRTLYAPMTVEQWRGIDEGVPQDFRYVIKANEHTVLPRFFDHPRFGEAAGEENPYFLDPGFARDEVVLPAKEVLGAGRMWFLLQFPASAYNSKTDTLQFLGRVAAVVGAMPSDVLCAVEVRSAKLLGDEYQAFLRDTGAIHCINLLPGMPDALTQARLTEATKGKAMLVRWLLHQKWRYEDAKAAFAPFDKIAQPDPGTRGDIGLLLEEAVAAGLDIVTLVNNKAEGSAPLSIEKLARQFAGGNQIPF